MGSILRSMGNKSEILDATLHASVAAPVNWSKTAGTTWDLVSIFRRMLTFSFAFVVSFVGHCVG